MAGNDRTGPFSSRKNGCEVHGCGAHWLHTVHHSCLYGQTCVQTLPYEYAVVNATTGNWAHLTSKHPQSPQKMGEGDKLIMVESRRVLSSFWFWGGGQTIPWFFIFFPYLFYHRLLVSNCSKFCVKQMGSTVTNRLITSWSTGRTTGDKEQDCLVCTWSNDDKSTRTALVSSVAGWEADNTESMHPMCMERHAPNHYQWPPIQFAGQTFLTIVKS